MLKSITLNGLLVEHVRECSKALANSFTLVILHSTALLRTAFLAQEP
jgi:hypothetical protein